MPEQHQRLVLVRPASGNATVAPSSDQQQQEQREQIKQLDQEHQQEQLLDQLQDDQENQEPEQLQQQLRNPHLKASPELPTQPQTQYQQTTRPTYQRHERPDNKTRKDYSTITTYQTHKHRLSAPTHRPSASTPVSQPPRRPRITVEMAEAARLGNLMFGYASLLGIARRNNFTPMLGLQQSNTQYLVDAFRLGGLIRKQLNTSVWRRVGEAMASAYDPQTERIGLSDEPAGAVPRDGDRFAAARDELSDVGGSFRKGLKALEDYFSSRLGRGNHSVGFEAEKENVADTDKRSTRTTKHLVTIAAALIADDVTDVGPPTRDDVTDDGVPKRDDVADVSESSTGDDIADDVVLDGYFQSWRYFTNVQDEVLQLFTFKARYRRIASAFLNNAIGVYYPPSNVSDLLRTSHSSPREVQSVNDGTSGGKNASVSSGVVTVGIHVRRGDMISEGARKQGYATAPAAYVVAAMAYMEERLAARNILYVVCSDDPGWFHQEVKLKGTLNSRPILYCPQDDLGSSSAAQDMAILAACDHTIMTVGSYGWWAGYLAGGTTVYYSRCLEEGSLIAKGFRAEDYFPPEWIGLTGER